MKQIRTFFIEWTERRVDKLLVTVGESLKILVQEGSFGNGLVFLVLLAYQWEEMVWTNMIFFIVVVHRMEIFL
jgi:hypothetical protein